MKAKGLHRLPTALSSGTGKLMGVGLVAVIIATFAVAFGSSAFAAGPVYPVMNTSETPPDGVWFRDNPAVSGPRLNGYGVYRGDRVELQCYGWGEALGPYANRLWYYSANLTRPSAPGRPNVGWLNAHYVDDKQNSNIPAPGVAPCGGGGGGGGDGGTLPSPGDPPGGGGGTRPIVQGCYDGVYWGRRTLTWSYGGAHRYFGNAYQAAANWNHAGANLNLVYVPPNQKPDILFVDEWVAKDEPKGGLFGDTPHDGGQWPFRITTTPPAPPLRLQTGTVTIKLYQKRLDDRGSFLAGNQLNGYQLDFRKTYTATHELGHALGLAHPKLQCGFDNTSVMGPWSPTWGYNNPQDFDRKELKALFP